MSIIAVEEKLRTKGVEGQNLFTIDKVTFYAETKKYIEDPYEKETTDGIVTITPDKLNTVNQFSDFLGLDTQALTYEEKLLASQDYLWGNVEKMRANNQPVPNATARRYMPQPEGNNYTRYLAALNSGKVSYSLPVISYLG